MVLGREEACKGMGMISQQAMEIVLYTFLLGLSLHARLLVQAVVFVITVLGFCRALMVKIVYI